MSIENWFICIESPEIFMMLLNGIIGSKETLLGFDLKVYAWVKLQ